MTQGKNLKRTSSPTMQQLQYLLELEKVAGKRGCVKFVAETCGVNHGSVSRFFKSCYEKGILTEENAFTSDGERCINGYKMVLKVLPKYLKMIGVKEEKVSIEVGNMIENMEWETLVAIVAHGQQMKRSLIEQTKAKHGICVHEKHESRRCVDSSSDNMI